MTPEQIAGALIRRAVSERIAELTDQWLAEKDQAKREELHNLARATIELEDHLSGRIDEYASE